MFNKDCRKFLYNNVSCNVLVLVVPLDHIISLVCGKNNSTVGIKYRSVFEEKLKHVSAKSFISQFTVKDAAHLWLTCFALYRKVQF